MHFGCWALPVAVMMVAAVGGGGSVEDGLDEDHLTDPKAETEEVRKRTEKKKRQTETIVARRKFFVYIQKWITRSSKPDGRRASGRAAGRASDKSH